MNINVKIKTDKLSTFNFDIFLRFDLDIYNKFISCKHSFSTHKIFKL